MLETLRELELFPRGVVVRFSQPTRLLSSCVVGGGLQRVRSFLNLQVASNPAPLALDRDYPPPETTIEQEIERLELATPVAAMMTAASMDSFRHVRREFGKICIEALLTSGLSNARRAGDPADQALPAGRSGPPGTINILVGTNVALSPAAMAEALILIGEVKAAVMIDLAYPSPASGRPATGTGTDSAGVYCGEGARVDYCGKHTLFGEHLAGAVAEALESSVAWYKG